MQVSTLKPCLLVAVKTTIKGNVVYKRTDLEADHQVGEGKRARWETEREIQDAQEHEAAVKVRGQARSLIAAVCAPSSFGLLCPISKEQDLLAAIEESRKLVNTYNFGAKLTTIGVFTIAGRIAASDYEAARAIADEVRSLMDDMSSGIKAADVSAVREAANKARALGSVLSPDIAGAVAGAVQQARSAAREIVRRVEKAGEAAADVVAELNTQCIDAARFMFLDMDEVTAAPAPAEQAQVSPWEFTDDQAPIPAAPAAPTAELEF